VNVTDLLVGLRVEVAHLLASRGVEGLFKVRGQAAPASAGLVGDIVFLVDALGPVGGLELGVKVGQRVSEFV
jgi:hypothetical protein